MASDILGGGLWSAVWPGERSEFCISSLGSFRAGHREPKGRCRVSGHKPSRCRQHGRRKVSAWCSGLSGSSCCGSSPEWSSGGLSGESQAVTVPPDPSPQRNADRRRVRPAKMPPSIFSRIMGYGFYLAPWPLPSQVRCSAFCRGPEGRASLFLPLLSHQRDSGLRRPLLSSHFFGLCFRFFERPFLDTRQRQLLQRNSDKDRVN